MANGIFSEITKQLKTAEEKIKAVEKVAETLMADETKTAEQKQAEYMKVYNEAILSFTRLPKDFERIAKTQRATMWRAKEYAIKKFYK